MAVEEVEKRLRAVVAGRLPPERPPRRERIEAILIDCCVCVILLAASTGGSVGFLGEAAPSLARVVRRSCAAAC